MSSLPSSSRSSVRRYRSLDDLHRTHSTERRWNRYSVDQRNVAIDAVPRPTESSLRPIPSSSAIVSGSDDGQNVILTISPLSSNESLHPQRVIAAEAQTGARPQHADASPSISHPATVHMPAPPPVPPPPPNSNTQPTTALAVQETSSWVRLRRILRFFGYGPNNHARKALVALIWNVSFDFVQFAVTFALVIYSARRPSPRDPSLTEWKACNRPLGVWNSLWLVRVLFGCLMSIWSWSRDRKMRQIEDSNRGNDAEAAHNNVDEFDLDGFDIGPRSAQGGQTTNGRRTDRNRRQTVVLPFSKLYAKLSLLISLFSISWFLTAHILVYTSLETCRLASPHLWWLSFGILCILYVMILEVFIIAIIVFIIGPLIYLFWNILLICLGRHPLQNPHYINPDIHKLPKSLVEQIPLVLYIPPPPDATEVDMTAKPTPVYRSRSGADHTYPPKSPQVPKWRFKFLRVRSRKADTGNVDGANGTHQDKGKAGDEKSTPIVAETWEDQWEGSEYPFVRLDGNRAACAICLMDFEEPKRVASDVIRSWASVSESRVDDTRDETVDADETGQTQEEQQPATTDTPGPRPQQIQEIPAEPASYPHLEDAGEGSQPLRLLPCGHVFHKTCIDPWLIDVSGRCPTCQRPVTLPEDQTKKRNSRRR